jgi:hypothetical protein
MIMLIDVRSQADHVNMFNTEGNVRDEHVLVEQGSEGDHVGSPSLIGLS